MNDPRRRIPSVDALLSSASFGRLLAERPRALVAGALRRTLENLRRELATGDRSAAPDEAEIAARTDGELRAMDKSSLRRVINATGVPLHTNLGRAPLAAAARAALAEIADGYSNLEYDLERGARGSRHDHCTRLLKELSGAGDALVVNNNAAAVVLVLNELAEGHEVVISRGELVEIGGSFRVPSIIAKSGARLVEVGATNRTHVRDYEEAIGPETRVLLKVHRSNFSQSGFVSEVDIEALAHIAKPAGLPVVYDLGSGLLRQAAALGLGAEPDLEGALEAGADIVTFSGDKLLGGPQAGIIVGRPELIGRIRKNPLLRAVRVGKLTLAALEATLLLWRDEETAAADIPAIAMIAADSESLRARAHAIAEELARRAPAARLEVVQDTTRVGGGSYPGGELETWVLRVTLPGRSEVELEAACRAGTPPVVGRIRNDALCLDPRTVAAHEEAEFLDAVTAALTADHDDATG